MSKGSRQRATNTTIFNENYKRIFNKSEDNMSSKNDFMEQNQDKINEEWNCYCNEINSTRHKYFMDSKVFTKNDKERFVISYIESHLI